MRVLIERYVAGDTATNAQRFLCGQATGVNDDSATFKNPSPQETQRYINRFLAIPALTHKLGALQKCAQRQDQSTGNPSI
jgi:hypothetical protein